MKTKRKKKDDGKNLRETTRKRLKESTYNQNV